MTYANFPWCYREIAYSISPLNQESLSAIKGLNPSSHLLLSSASHTRLNLFHKWELSSYVRFILIKSLLEDHRLHLSQQSEQRQAVLLGEGWAAAPWWEMAPGSTWPQTKQGSARVASAHLSAGLWPTCWSVRLSSAGWGSLCQLQCQGSHSLSMHRQVPAPCRVCSPGAAAASPVPCTALGQHNQLHGTWSPQVSSPLTVDTVSMATDSAPQHWWGISCGPGRNICHQLASAKNPVSLSLGNVLYLC